MAKIKLKKYIFPFFIIVILSFLQLSIIPLVAIGSVIPDLLIIYIVIFTLRHGQLEGTIYGSFSGLFFDLVSGGVIGSSMFAKTIGAFIAGYFYNENKIQHNISSGYLLLIVFLSSSLNSFFYLLLTSSEVKLTASHLFLEQGILPGLYTTIFALPALLINQKRVIE